jgi:hypothetical protein
VQDAFRVEIVFALRGDRLEAAGVPVEARAQPCLIESRGEGVGLGFHRAACREVPHSAALLNIVFVLTQSRATGAPNLTEINFEIFGWVIIAITVAPNAFDT